MTVLALLTLLAAQAFPSADQTSWMQPEAFRLTLTMTRSAATERLESAGWTTREGKEPGQLIVDYDDNRTITLAFVDGRLDSIRFELVDFIPEVDRAFDETSRSLHERLGDPDRSTEGILMYERAAPNIFVVKSTSPDSSFGRQGLGFLTVRYFVPSD